MKTLSIICPTYNEEKYIEKCIASILASDYDKGKLQVIFIDGMSTDNTRDIIARYIDKYDWIKLLDNPAQFTPNALNIGIRSSSGEIVIRLDAHALYPPNYFSVLVHYLDSLPADNVGVAYRSLPMANTLLCKAIAIAVSSPFGVGNSYCRLGTTKIMRVDTVPFGCFRREIFDRIGLFDEELIRNQDDEFNARIIKNGGKIFLIPDITIDYFSRDSLGKVIKMFYQYGLFKPLVNKKIGKPATVRQFAPLLFVMALIVGLVGSIFSKVVLSALIVMLILYLSAALFFAIRHRDVQTGAGVLPVLPVVFFAMHTSYGWGYIVGILKIIGKRRFSVQNNR